jgi:hypothetical protein
LLLRGEDDDTLLCGEDDDTCLCGEDDATFLEGDRDDILVLVCALIGVDSDDVGLTVRDLVDRFSMAMACPSATILTFP